MPAELGGGKYDDILNTIQWKTGAQLVCVIVVGGHRGNGFSVASTPELLSHLPSVLRMVAADIEKGGSGGTPLQPL